MVFILKQLVQVLREDVRPDLTWGESAGITLLNIEVNLSAVCASVPIFWTPLQNAIKCQWDRIFVTHEVSVVWTDRHQELKDGAMKNI